MVTRTKTIKPPVTTTATAITRYRVRLSPATVNRYIRANMDSFVRLVARSKRIWLARLCTTVSDEGRKDRENVHPPELEARHRKLRLDIPGMSVPLEAVLRRDTRDAECHGRGLERVSALCHRYMSSHPRVGPYKCQQYEDVIETKAFGYPYPSV